MTRTGSLVVGCVLLLGFVGALWAEIPFMMSYQGRVADASGNAVPDGNYTMRFRIYNDPTGGNLLWDSGDCTVAVSGGVFSVILGESPQPALNLPFDQDYWLQVTFQGVDQSPRQRLTSVGYAYIASGLVPGTEVVGELPLNGTAVIRARNTATSGENYAIFGRSYSSAGAGVCGWGTNVGASIGVLGRTQALAGHGVYGYSLSTTGFSCGVLGKSYSTGGHGVYGHSEATTGSAHGVYGVTNSPDGSGVSGSNSSTTGSSVGVQGTSSSTSGRGVYGVALATTGPAYGVMGESESSSGRGVYGHADATTGIAAGVYGQSASTAGSGVVGLASSLSGETYGVRGTVMSLQGFGVFGRGPFTGVRGEAYATSDYPVGVYGTVTTTSASGYPAGVYGIVQTTVGYGVYGRATAGDACGVYGFASSGTGVGVLGQGPSFGGGTGVYGVASGTMGAAVRGWHTRTTGVVVGVRGECASTSGYGVYSSGNFAASGTKAAVVNTSRGPTLLYCQESPENWFEDFGSGQLVDGRCHVELDPLFLETVTIDEANPMKVFVTPNGPLGQWWVEKAKTGFDLVAPEAVPGTRFDYRVVAKRRGYERQRMEYCQVAEDDAYLRPELWSKKLQELQAMVCPPDEGLRGWEHRLTGEGEPCVGTGEEGTVASSQGR